MPKILIIVQGGLVESVYSDIPNLDVRLLDLDILEDGLEEDEIDFYNENSDLLTGDTELSEKKILAQYPHNNY